MKNRLLSWLTYLIGWPFSIIALIFIIKIITPQLGIIYAHLGQINALFLLYAVVCFALFYFLKSFLWHRMLQSLGYTLRFHDTCFLWLTSEIKRYIPGNIWSFLGRSVLFAKHGVEKKDIAKSLLIEAEIMVLSGVIVSLFSLSVIHQYFVPHIPELLFWVIPMLVLGGTILYVYNRRFEQIIPRKIRFLMPAFSPLHIFYFLVIHCIAFIFYGVGYYFAIAAVAPLPPELILAFTGFFTLSFLVGYLSLLTPSGFGVREGIMVVGLVHVMPTNIAAFASIFSRIVLIISEILLLLDAYIWKKYKKELMFYEQFITTHKYELMLAFLMLLYALYFVPITFLRYDNFYTGRYDLGNMAQTVWNSMHGRIFVFTNPSGTEPISRLAFHADFMLVLLAPLYSLWSDPRNLLLIQTIVVDLGALFVYLIAKEVLKKKYLALIFALAFLINPSVERANLYDFHAVTLATTFLLGTYYFYRKKQYIPFTIFAILAGLCKEEVWLITGLFGVFLFIQQKRRIFGTIITLASSTIFIYLLWYAIPHTLGSQHFALSYYSDFGDGPGKIIKNILLSPQKTIITILQPDRLDYLNKLFLPLGYLSLLNPFILLFTGPDFLIDLLSNNAQLHQIYYQYTATITPFIFIAAILGAGFLIKRFSQKRMSLFLGIYLLGTIFCTAYFYGPIAGEKVANLDMITKPVPNREFIDNYLSHIPKRYSVASSNNVGSHLSQRQQLYTLPFGVDKADIIVFLLTDPTAYKSESVLAGKISQDPRYILIIHQDAFVVFARADLQQRQESSKQSIKQELKFYNASQHTPKKPV